MMRMRRARRRHERAPGTPVASLAIDHRKAGVAAHGERDRCRIVLVRALMIAAGKVFSDNVNVGMVLRFASRRSDEKIKSSPEVVSLAVDSSMMPICRSISAAG